MGIAYKIRLQIDEGKSKKQNSNIQAKWFRAPLPMFPIIRR